VCRLYGESDCRVFECRCPHCGGFSEIQWTAIEWPDGRPDLAAWRCPHCEALIEEKHKAKIVREGRWCAKRPEADPRHRCYRLNSLVSALGNLTWARLAAEFEAVRNDPDRLKVFHNTSLALPWKEGTEIDESALARRAEPFSLDALPEECLALTMGVDCADDRLEAVIAGWTKTGGCLVLDHQVIHGAIGDDLTWQQLDDVLRMRWTHPHGGQLRIDAAAIDAGDGQHLAHVLAFCRPRAARRVMAIKGSPGFSRPPLLASKSKQRGGGRLWIVGSDGIKSRIFDHLQRAIGIRFSDTLQPVFYEQLASERVTVKHVAGRPIRRFERIRGAKAEALDATCYAMAAKSALTLTPAAFAEREDQLRAVAPAKPASLVARSQWMERQHRRDPWG
jgi:phage terminase large subunit GpA-like protein